MACQHPIPISPFPPLERDYFAPWLSGLTDGEGCFELRHQISRNSHASPGARFSIMLRADDAPILGRIQSFFGCGVLTAKAGHRLTASKPTLRFSVSKASDLSRTIVPHFLKCPLQAKKLRDFKIWAQAVELISRVTSRRRVPRPKAPGGRTAGCFSRWGKGEVDQFEALFAALKAVRVYNVLAVTLTPPVLPVPRPPSLFDGLP